MGEVERGHTNDNIIWSGKDHNSVTVKLYVNERDHIIESHEVMENNFTAIYDTVESPDSVYESGDIGYRGKRAVFFKRTKNATYFPLLTKAIVEYNDERTEGFIVTAFPRKKEDGNVGVRTYPTIQLRSEK